MLQSWGTVLCAHSVGRELLNQRWIRWRQAAHVYNGWAHTCKQMADGINQNGKTSILPGLPLSIFTQRDLNPGGLGLLLSYSFSISSPVDMRMLKNNPGKPTPDRYTPETARALLNARRTIRLFTAATYCDLRHIRHQLLSAHAFTSQLYPPIGHNVKPTNNWYD